MPRSAGALCPLPLFLVVFFYHAALWRTVYMSGTGMLATLILGYPMAYQELRQRGRGPASSARPTSSTARSLPRAAGRSA